MWLWKHYTREYRDFDLWDRCRHWIWMNEWNTEHYGDACVIKVPVSLGRDASSFNINLWNWRWQTRWTQSVSLRTVTYLIKMEAHLEAIGSVFFKYWVAGEPDIQVPRVHYYSSISSLTVTCLIACVCVCVCVCVWAKSAQSCPTSCDPVDCTWPGSSVHEVLQARILEWVAISSSRGSSWRRDGTHVSCIAGRFFTTEPPGKPI